MAGKKQVIRRVDRSTIADFDEQLWPINCALLVLAGFVAGTIIATSRFDHALSLSNGYFRLILLAVAVVGLLAGSAWLHRRKAVRRMQLAVLLSLLVNLGIEVWLYRTYLDLTVETRDETSEWIDPTDLVMLPDYGHRTDEAMPAEEPLVQPVETVTPQAEPEPIERQPVERQPTPAERQPTTEPVTPSRQPSTVAIQRAPSPTSAPRRSDSPSGQLSRQTATLPTPPRDATPAPAATATEPATTQPLEARAAPLERRSTSQPQLQRRLPSPEATAAPRRVESQPTERQSRSEASPSPTPAAELASRQRAALAPQPSAAEPLPAAEVTDTASNRVAEPTNVEATRQQTTVSSEKMAASESAADAPQPRAARVTPNRATAPSRDSPAMNDLAARSTLPRASPSPAATATDAQAAEQPSAATAAEPQTLQLQASTDGAPQRQAAAPAMRGKVAAASPSPSPAGSPIAQANVPRAASNRQEASSNQTAAGTTPLPSSNLARTATATGEAAIPASAAAAPEGAGLTASSSPAAQPQAGADTAIERAASAVPSRGSQGVASTTTGTNAAGTTASIPARQSGRDLPASGAPSASTSLGRNVGEVPISASMAAEALPDSEAAPSVAAGPMPATAQADEPARRASELPGELLKPSPIASGTTIGRSPSVLPGLPGGLSRAPDAEAGPEVAAAATSVTRQTATASLPAGLAEADEPGPIASSTSDGPTAEENIGPAVDELARRESGLSPAMIAAEEGPGGISTEPSTHVGLPNRRARPDSEAIHQAAQRFVMSRQSAVAAVDARAFDPPSPAFQQRAPSRRQEAARSQGGSSGSERAVEMGLDYLARQQLPDGRWSLQNVAVGASQADRVSAGQMEADTAATGMALLCFLGAGYTHTEGKYRDTVGAAVAHLVAHQKPDGDLFSGGSRYVWLYSHGIAAIALCEAYGMTGDRALRQPSQKALDFIVAAQHPVEGGWRYSPRTSTDTSVSGWQMMALKSGELAGLTVPDAAYEGVERWLDTAQGKAGASRYSYQPDSKIPHHQQPSPAMTAEGLLMRLYTGWSHDDPRVLSGADYLRQNLPAIGTRARPLRDAYYWYYATQVMFQVQGEHWNVWNERLRSLLLPTQVQAGPLAGSWDPRGAVNDRWGIEAGRLYVTAMHLLMLEVYYRHLPLYQTLQK